MASRNNVALALALITVFFFSGQLVQAQTICHFNELDAKCRPFLQVRGPLTRPSVACCEIIQHMDLLCLCRAVTPEIEAYFSMHKLAYVAGYCRRPLPRGTRCGSYTVPLA